MELARGTQPWGGACGVGTALPCFPHSDEGVVNNDCFVIMPYGKKKSAASKRNVDFDRVYEGMIFPAVENFLGLRCVRCDRIDEPGSIHRRMMRQIFRSPRCRRRHVHAQRERFLRIGGAARAEAFRHRADTGGRHSLALQHRGNGGHRLYGD